MPAEEAAWRRPADLAEALRWKARDPGLRPLAGGTDLMVERALDPAPVRVLDLFGLPELCGVRRHGDRTWIGAATCWSDIARDGELAERHPILVEAARTIGSVQIQNRGTVGGNIANASPAGDSLPVLLALDAVVEVASARRGSRFVPMDRLFAGYRKLRVEPDELIVGVWLPPPLPREVSCYRKVGTRAAQAISKVVMAARLRLDEGGAVAEARVAYGAVAPVPLRLLEVEDALLGRPPDPAVAPMVARRIEPIDDIRSTAAWRRRVAVNILRAWLESLLPASR